jgi:hypothetical protein
MSWLIVLADLIVGMYGFSQVGTKLNPKFDNSSFFLGVVDLEGVIDLSSDGY